MDWSRLVAAISSELLSFDEAPDPTVFVASPRAAAAIAGAAAQDSVQLPAGGLQHQSSIASQIGSPRSAAAGGERLDINSGAWGQQWAVGAAGVPPACKLRIIHCFAACRLIAHCSHLPAFSWRPLTFQQVAA